MTPRVKAVSSIIRTDTLRALILYEPPIQVGDNELDIAEMETMVKRGENEQALVLFERDLAGLPPDELDGLRATPIWREMVDAARTLPRELRAISAYEFDAARFADVTAPTLLLTGSESPSQRRDGRGSRGASERPDRYLRGGTTHGGAHRTRPVRRRGSHVRRTPNRLIATRFLLISGGLLESDDCRKLV
ncbi:hypothetical protein [Natrinema salifodinae]|uniref:hypothetical protein n=1 Tax=Natrinema salifodinae TaxID=1202768 RepID=UPI0011600C2B|nr:hypothetical protein [Natrinema salifodinae]